MDELTNRRLEKALPPGWTMERLQKWAKDFAPIVADVLRGDPTLSMEDAIQEGFRRYLLVAAKWLEHVQKGTPEGQAFCEELYHKLRAKGGDRAVR